MNGIVNNVIKLLIEVKVIERATFPLKKYVSTPDVVPPGHDARTIIPTFNARDRSEKYDTMKAMTGRTRI